MQKSVFLDAGHGAGRSFNRGYKGSLWKNEGDANFYYTMMVKKELEMLGIRVGLSRPSINDNPSLAQRGQMARGYDLFISEHTNAGGGYGVEVYNDVNCRPDSLSKDLALEFSRLLGTRNRGVFNKYSGGGNWYGVLRNNAAKKGILFEKCFHDNKAEVEKFERLAPTLAKVEANLIAKYLGVKGNNVNVPSGTVSNNVEGEDIMNTLKAKYVISYKKGQKDLEAVNKIISYFVLGGSTNIVVASSEVAADFKKVKDENLTIIAVGGANKSAHTSYADYYIPDLKAANDFYSGMSNWNKYKL